MRGRVDKYSNIVGYGWVVSRWSGVTVGRKLDEHLSIDDLSEVGVNNPSFFKALAL